MATRNGKSTPRAAKKPIFEVRSADSVRRTLDRESRRTLGISGEEFIQRLRDGRVEYSTEEIRLAALAELVRHEP